ncbi:hypothetical protein NUH16_007745 [Penicillium rubens]|nr:hypothetical protein NUH16_007745 [Penicillium rubens]
MCGQLVKEKAGRVVYKNYSFGVKIFSIDMVHTFGGTNWGNLGYMGGHTSYDYCAAITEERMIWRGKYSGQKLQANFLKSDSNSSSRSERYLRRTPLYSRDCYPWEWDIGKFLCHRTFGPHIHRQHSVHAHIANKQGRGIKIPQLGGALTLDGSDHKFHVTDYDVGGINLTYSSAEIFTWARGSGSTRVLILYGGAGETHEFGLPSYLGKPTSIEGDHIEIKQRRSAWVVKWHVTPARRIVRVADLQVYLLWRNVSYNYWVTELPVLGPIGNYSSPSKDVIVEAGYLIRTADLINNQLRLTGDVDGTTEIEVISTPATRLKVIALDREVVQISTTSNVNLRGTVRYNAPKLDVPDLSNLEWKFIDPLPEIQASYDDSSPETLHTELNKQS